MIKLVQEHLKGPIEPDDDILTDIEFLDPREVETSTPDILPEPNRLISSAAADTLKTSPNDHPKPGKKAQWIANYRAKKG